MKERFGFPNEQMREKTCKPQFMSIDIKKLLHSKLPKAMKLVWQTFLKVEPPEHSEEAEPGHWTGLVGIFYQLDR